LEEPSKINNVCFFIGKRNYQCLITDIGREQDFLCSFYLYDRWNHCW